jgi:hypothetical protein
MCAFALVADSQGRCDSRLVTDPRAFLLDALRRVRDGGNVTNDELLGRIPDPSQLDPTERAAWYCLSHWADDDDIRAKDGHYAEMQQRQIGEALDDLEARVAGFLPSEFSRGEHRAWHMPMWGCTLVVIASVAGLYFLLSLLLSLLAEMSAFHP